MGKGQVTEKKQSERSVEDQEADVPERRQGERGRRERVCRGNVTEMSKKGRPKASIIPPKIASEQM